MMSEPASLPNTEEKFREKKKRKKVVGLYEVERSFPSVAASMCVHGSEPTGFSSLSGKEEDKYK